MANIIKFKLIKVRKIIDTDFYNASISLGDLARIGKVPTYKSWQPLIDGYQRDEKQKRIDDIRDRVIQNPKSVDALVDSINLNIRVADAQTHINPINKNENDYGDFFSFKYIDAYGPAYIVDGQHRCKGLISAMDKAKNDGNMQVYQELRDSRISVLLTLTDNVYKEAYIFFLINKYAKAVPPDGAHRLIVEGFNAGDVNFVNEVSSGSMSLDDIDAANVTDNLAAHSKVWANRIRDFNETGASKLSARALTLMISPLYKECKNLLRKTGSKIDPKKFTYDVIEAYWGGLEAIFNNTIFNPLKEREYGMMKSSQTEVMFKVLLYIVKYEKETWTQVHKIPRIGNLDNFKTYEKLLKNPLTKFTGINSSNVTVTGHECWYIGKAGSMGKYTSSAAKRDIARELITKIEASIGITNPTVV